MGDPDIYRKKAEQLLDQAARTPDMAARARLVQEALHWHRLALEGAGHGRGGPAPTGDDDQGPGEG